MRIFERIVDIFFMLTATFFGILFLAGCMAIHLESTLDLFEITVLYGLIVLIVRSGKNG